MFVSLFNFFFKDGFDYSSAYSNIIIERREHNRDSNRQSNSELETVNLKIINTNFTDTAYYLCIVANSADDYRSTYAYLNVTESNDYDEYLMAYSKNSFKFDKFIRDNKLLIIISSFTVAIVGIILLLLFIYCCSTQIVKNRITKINEKKDFNDTKLPNMNSIIEKTMNTMRKVIDINLTIVINYFFFV